MGTINLRIYFCQSSLEDIFSIDFQSVGGKEVGGKERKKNTSV